MTFAEFDVDAAAGELRRGGERVKIQDLPFRMLVTLLSRPGEIVTRDELRAALWGAGTHVDAEAGLNTAIAKLREALGDNADAPRFIETVPRRGYRFLGTVSTTTSSASIAVPAAAPVIPTASRRQLIARVAVLGAVVAAAVLFQMRTNFAGRWLPPPPTTIAVVLFHNETENTAHDQLAQQLTDATVVRLAQNRRFSVIGNAAILRTPRIFADIKKIADELRADYLVLGQLQKNENGLIVRAHFIRASDQKHLWAQGIPGETGAFERLVPETIAQGIESSLAATQR